MERSVATKAVRAANLAKRSPTCARYDARGITAAKTTTTRAIMADACPA